MSAQPHPGPHMPGIDPALAHAASGLTVADHFAARVRLGPDRPAVEDGRLALSYAALADRAARLAGVFAGRGLARGARVAVLSENRGEFLELFLACAQAGLIACCQNWRLADEELRHCLRLVGPAVLLASPRFAETAARVAPAGCEAMSFGDGYEAALAAAAPAAPDPAVHPEDGLLILYTSGTTGLPKGALISHRAEIARAMVAATDLPTTAEDGFVAWAPLFHMASADTALATLMRGGKVMVMDGYDAPALAAIVARERIGRLTLMPGTIQAFIEAMEAQGLPAKGVKYAGVMADLVPRDQIVAVTRLLDAPYLNTFGATETGSTPVSAGMIPVGARPERLDKTLNTWCRTRLVDADDNEVPDGQPGEMAVRGPTLFSGYWNNPEANAKDFRGGWFHMGDMFTRNPDGTLSFVDRSKYLIKSGGENIYPAEIERVLLSDPRIYDACVVRKADAKWGETPVAFVALNPGAEATEAEIIAGFDGRIARYKRPSAVRFVSDADLPRSTTGKIKRHELEERLRAEG
ncbi:MAG: AMP-binding protein [Pseudomonadota bacterium]|nr:AMP-binding protein [Pseudomonadota bacterium]MEE3101040.1 AMP-binding protein [Pseudomonadota bacterium]